MRLWAGGASMARHHLVRRTFANEAVDHYVNSEATSLIDVSGNEFGNVGGDERKFIGG
jgi:hypothetical protein